jgi:hypothetical protein
MALHKNLESVATTSQLLAAPASCQRRLRDKTVCGAHLGYFPIRLSSHEWFGVSGGLSAL